MHQTKKDRIHGHLTITKSAVLEVAAADDRSEACEGGAVESPSGETAWSSLSAVGNGSCEL